MSNNRVTPKRFGLASAEWPGLAKVGEEAAEVLQEILKIVATGGAMQYANGQQLDVKKLFSELGDLSAALDFFLAQCNSEQLSIWATQRDTKMKKYSNWHETEKRS